MPTTLPAAMTKETASNIINSFERLRFTMTEAERATQLAVALASLSLADFAILSAAVDALVAARA